MYLQEYIIIGIISGLSGCFYRNLLVGENQIFNFVYNKWLQPWAEGNNNIKSFIAYPLGYCIYCSSTWIAIILTTIEFSCWQHLPCWQYLVLAYICTISIQHLIVLILGKFILEHPDFKE